MSSLAAGRAGVPDYSRGYLRVPLDVWLGTFCRGTLTRRQLQLVAVVLRESWGWHDREGRPYTWTRPLSSAAFSRLTGIAPDHARREVRGLLARGVLAEAAGRYRFVPDAERAVAPTRAEGPVNLSAGAAETGGPGPVPKTAKDSQTNVAPDRPSAFAALLAGFAGPLPPREVARLRRWVEREGVAAVWTQLGPRSRSGRRPPGRRSSRPWAGVPRRRMTPDLASAAWLAMLAGALALAGLAARAANRSSPPPAAEPAVHWAVRFPHGASFPAAEAAEWFAALASRLAPGGPVPWCELRGEGGRVSLLLGAPRSWEGFLRAQLAAWFPEARLEALAEAPAFGLVAAVALGLEGPEVLPLRVPAPHAADPLLSVAAALAGAGPAGVRLRLASPPPDWQRWAPAALEALQAGLPVPRRGWEFRLLRLRASLQGASAPRPPGSHPGRKSPVPAPRRLLPSFRWASPLGLLAPRPRRRRAGPPPWRRSWGWPSANRWATPWFQRA